MNAPPKHLLTTVVRNSGSLSASWRHFRPRVTDRISGDLLSIPTASHKATEPVEVTAANPRALP